jgi:hypothetical protein
MQSCGMLRRVALVALVRTDVSDERSASTIRVTIIGELGTTLAVTSKRRRFELEVHGTQYQKASVIENYSLQV